MGFAHKFVVPTRIGQIKDAVRRGESREIFRGHMTTQQT